jgi:hypothetical protein
VNLGNVLPGEVLGLEALRLGLRADTMTASPAGAAGVTTAPTPDAP